MLYCLLIVRMIITYHDNLHASANTILRKFASCSIPITIQLLESYCCNFHCAALWCDYPKRALQKLKVAYNNIFRKCLGFNFRDSARDSHMFVNNRLYTFDARIRKSCFSFRGRSTNVIIHALNNNSWITNNYMWYKWKTLLYNCSPWCDNLFCDICVILFV